MKRRLRMMSDLVPGDLVEILHFAKPSLAVIIKRDDRTHHLFDVLMMNDESRNKIFRYSSLVLKKIS